MILCVSIKAYHVVLNCSFQLHFFRKSNLNLDAKHPILLPKSHHITTLIIDNFHMKYLYAGPQLLQSLISQHYWILSARSIIRSRVFRCTRCFRSKPSLKQPLMGDLPESRITPARPFSRTGVDFGGPFHIKMHLQKSSIIKSIFVCFCMLCHKSCTFRDSYRSHC